VFGRETLILAQPWQFEASFIIKCSSKQTRPLNLVVTCGDGQKIVAKILQNLESKNSRFGGRHGPFY